MLGKICIKPVVTASAQMTVDQAARAMRSKNVGALVVVNAGRPVGMLTDRDIAVEVVARGMDPEEVRVGDVMVKKPVTIRQDLGIFDAAKAFAKTGVRRLPVVTSSGVLVGVITMDDVLMLLGNEMGHMAGRPLGRAAAGLVGSASATTVLATDAIRQDPRAVARDVLGIVSGLVDELGGRSGDRPVGLDDALDRDLGIGSLERVELLLRLEQRFGVRLPDAVMAEAVSPRDLVTRHPGRRAAGARGRAAALARRSARPRRRRRARRSSRCSRWHAEATPSACTSSCGTRMGRSGRSPMAALWQRAQRRRGLPARAEARPGRHGGAHAQDRGGLLRRLLRRPARRGGARAHLSAVPARPDRGVRAAPGRHPPQRGRARASSPSRRPCGWPRCSAPACRRSGTSGRPRPRAARAGSVRRRARGAGGPRADPVHLGQHRGAEGRAALAREPAREHPGHRRGDRDPPRRRRRELAAALPRHGADRVLAGRALLRHPDRDPLARWPSSPVRRAGCGRSTPTAPPSPPRPTSPSISASAG